MKRTGSIIGLGAAAASVALLDATGTPIPKPEGIPFIQWIPGGKSVGRVIDRGAAVAAQAAPFLACNGRYAQVFRVDGVAELVAGFMVQDGEPGEMYLVAEEVVPNGVEIGPAVDRLVAASVANLNNLPIGETVQ